MAYYTLNSYLNSVQELRLERKIEQLKENDAMYYLPLIPDQIKPIILFIQSTFEEEANRIPENKSKIDALSLNSYDGIFLKKNLIYQVSNEAVIRISLRIYNEDYPADHSKFRIINLPLKYVAKILGYFIEKDVLINEYIIL